MDEDLEQTDPEQTDPELEPPAPDPVSEHTDPSLWVDPTGERRKAAVVRTSRTSRLSIAELSKLPLWALSEDYIEDDQGTTQRNSVGIQSEVAVTSSSHPRPRPFTASRIPGPPSTTRLLKPSSSVRIAERSVVQIEAPISDSGIEGVQPSRIQLYESSSEADEDAEIESAPASDQDVEIESVPASNQDAEIETEETSNQDVEIETVPAYAEIESAPPGSNENAEVESEQASDQDVEIESSPVSDQDVEIESSPVSDQDAEIESSPASGQYAEIEPVSSPALKTGKH